MVIKKISPKEVRSLGPVALDQTALTEIGKAVSALGTFKCRVRDSRGDWFDLSSPEDFVDLTQKASHELKFVSMWVEKAGAREPVLSVELCRDRAKLRHNSGSGDVLQAAQQIHGICRSRARKWIESLLVRSLAASTFAVVIAAAASLLISAIAGAKWSWWLVMTLVIATMVLAPACRFVLGRIICHAYMYNGPDQDRPGFFRRNKDAILVTLLGAVAVTVLSLAAKSL
ncbi:hypothetical protein [Nonomuraea fuscirosea]|uniref:hypothetical protein n=1 Tax=Nonomuraea fuscirosea TaxID=1291556 RepID=UPI0033E2CCB8